MTASTVQSARQANAVGDVVRALARLEARKRATQLRILEALGWAQRQEGPARPSAATRRSNVALASGDGAEPSSEAASDRPEPEQRAVVPSSMSKLGGRDTGAAALDDSVGLLPLPKAETYVPLYERAIEPLFAPAHSRAIISRLSTVLLPVGELDVSSVVGRVARGRPPLTWVPRRSLPSLSGLQLLIASDPGLDPFRVDIESVVRQIAGIAGRDRLQILAFAGCPVRGVYDPTSGDLVAYQPPPSRTSVVAISDLDACQSDRFRSRMQRDWWAFARLLAGRGVPLTVLNPYPSNRVSSSLRKHLRIVIWDRETSVRSIITPATSAYAG